MPTTSAFDPENPPKIDVPETEREQFHAALCAGAVCPDGFWAIVSYDGPQNCKILIEELGGSRRAEAISVSFRVYLRQEDPEAWAKEFARVQVTNAIQRIREQGDNA